MDDIFESSRDTRLRGLWLMDSPSGILCVTAMYLMFVYKVGPALMKSRQPMCVTPFVRAFNLLQVIANVYFIVYGIYIAFYRLRFRVICEPLHQRVDLDNSRLVNLYYFYWLVRLSDYLDTIFFILRKKHSHVTFLHVYHHICVSLNGWLYVRQGWIHGALIGVFMNATIHVVMYSYFLLATFPRLRPYLWWKKYLTSAQILQFVVFGILVISAVQDSNQCGYSDIAVYNCLGNIFLFLFLFSKFYMDSYMNNAKQKLT